MNDYAELYSNMNASDADYISSIISNSVDIATNIMSVRTQKYELEAKITNIKALRDATYTEYYRQQYEDQIAYYEYLDACLDQALEILEEIQERQHRKKMIIYGVSAFFAASAVLFALAGKKKD